MPATTIPMTMRNVIRIFYWYVSSSTSKSMMTTCMSNNPSISTSTHSNQHRRPQRAMTGVTNTSVSTGWFPLLFPNLSLRSINGLPISTQMMAFGPDSSYTPIQADFEALQVACWVLDCFVSSVPITHPGGQGYYDAMPGSYEAGCLDVASQHHATRAVPITQQVGFLYCSQILYTSN